MLITNSRASPPRVLCICRRRPGLVNKGTARLQARIYTVTNTQTPNASLSSHSSLCIPFPPPPPPPPPPLPFLPSLTTLKGAVKTSPMLWWRTSTTSPRHSRRTTLGQLWRALSRWEEEGMRGREMEGWGGGGGGLCQSYVDFVV